jgi:hypothetical protein
MEVSMKAQEQELKERFLQEKDEWKRISEKQREMSLKEQALK